MPSTPLKIFIGYDPREDIAFQVCKFSIIRRTSISVEIRPIRLTDLRRDFLYWRKTEVRDGLNYDELDQKPYSTEFSYSRFLVPDLCGYSGRAIFLDCDFLFRSDVADLSRYFDPEYPVSAVKHDYWPTDANKMDGQVQSRYWRKNWSSLILWNCEHYANSKLSPYLVNNCPGLYLHQFQWLEDDQILGIPKEWNYLCGTGRDDTPKAIHYTAGGPWFEGFKDVEYAQEWLNEYEIWKSVQ